jgi:hypothetical protein
MWRDVREPARAVINGTDSSENQSNYGSIPSKRTTGQKNCRPSLTA